MKIANIDREFLHIFWMTWGNSTRFSRRMCFKTILNVTKNQGFSLSLEDTFFEKLQGGQIDPLAVVGSKQLSIVHLRGKICIF